MTIHRLLPPGVLLVCIALSHELRPAWLGISAAFYSAFHAPVFACLTVLLVLYLRRFFPPLTSLAWAAGLALLAGVGGEIVQGFGKGHPEWTDLALDLAGTFAVVSVLAIFHRPLWANRKRWQRVALGSLAVGLMLVTMLPPLWYTWVLVERQSAMPVLLTFERLAESPLYMLGGRSKLSEVSTHGVRGRGALLILDRPRKAAINFHAPYPDWTGFEALSFTALSLDGSEVEVNLRIHDREHNHQFKDRFNQSIRIGPGPTKIRIPLSEVLEAPEGRKMDLTAIDGLILFGSGDDETHQVLVDEFRLE